MTATGAAAATAENGWSANVWRGGGDLLTEQANLTAVRNDITPIKRSQSEDRIAVRIGYVAFGLHQDRRHLRFISVMPHSILRHRDLERLALLSIVALLAENRAAPVDIVNSRWTASDKAHCGKCRPCHSVTIGPTINVCKWGGSRHGGKWWRADSLRTGVDGRKAAVAPNALGWQHKAMRVDPSEYMQLRSWFSHMVPKVFPSDLLTPDTHPIAILDAMAVKTPAKARSGLGMAIGDILEFTSDWPTSDVTACDHELSQSGLPTLSAVRARFSKLVQRVVRRGQIKSEDEFYALRNAVEQQCADSASLWPLLAAYEARN
jgi:hypothetical protein